MLQTCIAVIQRIKTSKKKEKSKKKVKDPFLRKKHAKDPILRQNVCEESFNERNFFLSRSLVTLLQGQNFS